MFGRRRRLDHRKVTSKDLRKLFTKRILRRGFNRKQRECLNTWFEEWYRTENAKDLFSNPPQEQDAIEELLIEIKNEFMDWAEANKTLDPRIWN